MFEMDYTEGIGWHDAVIKPYGPIEIMPSAMVLHYAQEVFEGLKAYKTPSGEVQLFRPDENFKRMNRSNARMCIPQIDEDFLLEALKALVKMDEAWIPKSPGTSLYIRPFVFATDPFIGVRVSKRYKFMIIMSPVGSYYKGGMVPSRIYVESEYARTVWVAPVKPSAVAITPAVWRHSKRFMRWALSRFYGWTAKSDSISKKWEPVMSSF